MVGVRGRRCGLDACHAANRRALATSRNAQPGARFRCRNPSPFEPLLGGQRPLVQAQAADRISATRLDDRGRRSLPARRSVQRHGRSPPHSGSGRTADRLAGEPHVAPLRRGNWTNPDQSLAVDGDPCTATTGKREGRRRAARRARRVVLGTGRAVVAAGPGITVRGGLGTNSGASGHRRLSRLDGRCRLARR
jgi:hypothetical protein